MKKIAINTLGCKVNQFESAAFATAFEEQGHALVPFHAPADIHVINTCSVTARAAQQSRQLIRRARKNHPHSLIIVTGCYAQIAPEIISTLCEAPLLIIDNANKQHLVHTALANASSGVQYLLRPIHQQKKICDLPVKNFPGRTRAYLRIQDGCNNFCSYCIVPHTRGRSRSLPLAAVFHQAELLAAQGYREFVITGINVGQYGLDLSEQETIYTLLARLCRHFPDQRIRLSSIEPTEVNDALLDLLSTQTNLMPHLHIPLQSGDDEILVQMRRRYTRTMFAAVIEKLSHTLPSITIGCDVLTGFPGETEQAAENTRKLLADLPLCYLHIFPYSKREGTLAASLTGQVSEQVKKLRAQGLHELDTVLRRQWYQKSLGQVHSVLIEKQQKKNNLLQGFAENYLPVLCNGSSRHLRKVVRVKLHTIEHRQIIGHLAEDILEEQK